MEDPENPSPALLAECAGMFHGAIPATDLVDPPEVLKAGLAEMGKRFTHTVGLFQQAPSLHIRKLGRMIWEIIGNKVVLLSVGPNVPTLSFVMTRDTEGVEQAAIVLPHAWLQMIELDPVMQAGAIIWNGSKAVDYYNKMPIDNWDERGTVYEAELLHIIRQDMPDHPFTKYQKGVMGKYPQGWETPSAAGLLYESKPFHLAQA